MLDKLKMNRSRIETIALRYGVSNIRVFGSTVRGEQTPESDLDLLVTLSPARSLMDLAGFVVAIETELQCRVDVVADDNILPALQPYILQEAIAL